MEAAPADKQDLLFDTQEFLRKLGWKAFFKQNPHLSCDEMYKNDIHQNLRVTGSSHSHFSHPILDKIKTKLLGWVSNLTPSEAKSNLSPQELRGRKLLLDLINKERVFVTKADKGGATLVLDYQTVVDVIVTEISDTCKYNHSHSTIDQAMESTKKKVIQVVLQEESKGNISSRDKTLITGLNSENNMKHSPEYRPLPPKIWPLFKVHKLSEQQIKEKKTPPQRFVNAAKYGPLYRLGKWSSPHLTEISKAYCGDEYLLDTPDLLHQICNLNSEYTSQGNKLLATLDVEALYPSIDKNLALEAMKEAFSLDTTTSTNIKSALLNFTEVSLNEAFVTYRGKVYQPKKGIPTGGCESRQIADMFLHWLLFSNLKRKINMWNFVDTFKRFIDDVFLVWKGTQRQFSMFVGILNRMAAPFGIRFGSWDIGRSVDFLDVTLYLDEEDKIQYKLYTKPTDARNYLRTDSFHPPHVFKSVAFSQMLRVVNRNSRDDTCKADLEVLKTDLVRSRQNPVVLNKLEAKVSSICHSAPNENNAQEQVHTGSLVFPVDYFVEMPQLKKLLVELQEDVSRLIGPVKITVAARKRQSIANRVLRNGAICEIPRTNVDDWSQKCGAARCVACRLMVDGGEVFRINGQSLSVPNAYNCKTRHCIYCAQCTICKQIVLTLQEDQEDTYFGQTLQKLHQRISGHRNKFNGLDYEKSALSLHAYESHPDHFNIDIFKFAVIKSCHPLRLNREEFKFIDKFSTNRSGINRCQVQR